MVLLKKLLNNWFDEFFSVRENFSFLQIATQILREFNFVELCKDVSSSNHFDRFLEAMVFDFDITALGKGHNSPKPMV